MRNAELKMPFRQRLLSDYPPISPPRRNTHERT
jgi:hypothetical protein